MSGRIKERIAQIPQFKSLVGEVLVLYLLQAHLAHAVQINLKLLACNQFKITVDRYRESVVLMDVVQDREEDYKQLFVKVDLSLFVHGTQINGIAVLNDCWSCSYRAIPIYLVESCMDIAEYVEKEILVVLVELYQ